MNREAAAVFLNLIGQGIRMTPIFICLRPKHGQYENIAAFSVYIWVIMIAVQSLFKIPDASFFLFRFIFNTVFFLVLLVFFHGSVLIKAFLYISAWFFEELLTSLDAFLGWVFRAQSTLSYEHICLILAVIMFVLYAAFVQGWLKKRVLILFDGIPLRDSALFLAVPLFFLILLFFGRRTIFNTTALLSGTMPVLVFYLVFCLMALIVYVMMIADRYRLMEQRESKTMLEAARRIFELQRDNYSRIQDYQQQIRIIRHDFRHHIHALEHMEPEEQREYLSRLQRELDSGDEIFFCSNPAVNSLLQEYAALARSEDIRFETHLAFGNALPVDNLTLCVILGNLLQNAYEACCRCETFRQIRLYIKSEEGALRIMVENSFSGKLRQQNGRLLSTKADGGLGMISIRRLLDHPKDDFDYYVNEDTFTAMIYLADRR